MKKIFIFVYIILASSALVAQEIDELTVDKEVLVFVKKHFRELKNFQLGIKVKHEENQLYLDSLEYSPWYTGDFNGDGLMDLFIAGYDKKEQNCYIILTHENEEYGSQAEGQSENTVEEESSANETETESNEEVSDSEKKEEKEEGAKEKKEKKKQKVEKKPEPSMEEFLYELIPVEPKKQKGNMHVPLVEEYKKIPLIIYKQFTTEVKDIMKNGMPTRIPNNYNDYYKMAFIRKDTFVYKFNSLVEYNEEPRNLPIRYIQFHDFCQFGGCPDYKLKIDSTGKMIYYKLSSVLDEKKVFQAQLPKEDFQELQDMINYLRLAKKDLKFGDSGADAVCTVQIVGLDGTIYKIMDYDKGGTFGLTEFYAKLIFIKDNTNWE